MSETLIRRARRFTWGGKSKRVRWNVPFNSYCNPGGFMTIRSLSSKFCIALMATSLGVGTVPSQVFAATQGNQPQDRLSKAEILDQALYTFKQELKNGAQHEKSIEVFANKLVETGIGIKDIKTYVRVHSTPEDYAKFETELNAALGSVKVENATSEELNLALRGALASVNPQGLAFTGCAGLAGGIVLGVGAIVVGIVALTKTKGEARIRSQYLNRMNNLSQDYQNEKYRIENRVRDIDLDIVAKNRQIASNNQRISYLTGAIANSSDTVKIQQYAQELQNLTAQNNDLNMKIAGLTTERAQYADDSYRNQLLTQLQSQYELDYAQLQTERDNRIKMVPTEKALAGKLGIVAGVAAAAGTLLIIDGAGDCN